MSETGEAAEEEKEIPSELCLPAFRKGDEFLFSLSEFVKPALPIRFLRAKQGYILFEYPTNVTGQLRLNLRLFFVAPLAKYDAMVSFSGEVYRIFDNSELGVPALIVKAPSFFTYRQERRQDPRVSIEVPVRFWRTGSFRHGVLEDLAIGGARFRTAQAEGLGQGDKVNLELDHPAVKLSGPITGRILRVAARPGTKDSIVGVEFDELDPNDREALDLFINKTLLNG